jgi:hypothetical protein
MAYLSHLFETPFHAAFKDHTDYYTKFTQSGNQRNTVLDHVVHTPLPSDVHVAYLGTLNSDLIRSKSDHLAQWTSLAIERDVPLVLPGVRIPAMLRGEIDPNNKEEINEYGELVDDALGTA